LKRRKINFKLTAYPQEIHKLSTKCGKLVDNFGDERVRKLRCVLSSKKYPESLDVEGFIDYN